MSDPVEAEARYAAFLDRKRRAHQPLGVDVPTDDIHPMLHPWQRAIVQWACHRGRAAIFADCGLGKTFMQLEWARHVAETTLIVAPLSVARQTAREAAVTLEDIAIKVDLSISSVSRCLRDHPRHSPASIARVKAVAAELGYEPPGSTR